MNWFKRLFNKKEDNICINSLSCSPKEEVFLHIEHNPTRRYFTNESPDIKKWCQKQLKRNK